LADAIALANCAVAGQGFYDLEAVPLAPNKMSVCLAPI
jgi:hypothetical protein